MALTASRTTAGFELIGNLMNVTDNGRLFLLKENTAFKKGDMVVMTNGKVDKAAAGATNVLGVMAEAVSTTDNPDASETYGKVFCNPFNIYRCTFADHLDSTATGGTTTTLIDTALSTSADDYWNGAYLYIYEGTNAGEARTAYDYTGTSDTLAVEKAYPAAPDTTSKYIMLGGGTEANDGINVGSIGIDLKDENTIDAGENRLSSTIEVGPLVCLAIHPQDLMMDVIIRSHLFNAGIA